MKVGEIGRKIYVATLFDLSVNTELTIKFTNPSGTVTFLRTKTLDGVTAPAVDSPPLPNDVGVLPANTYMVYTSKAGDFEEGGSGEWTVCTRYADATPKLFFGNDGPFQIDPAC